MMFGKSERTAKKDSTKRLEEYVVNKLAGRGAKVPQFRPEEKREIQQAVQKGGIMAGINLAAYRVKVATGTDSKSAFLRLSVMETFSAFYDGAITSQHVNELMSRLPGLDDYDNIRGIYYMELEYVELFESYAEELRSRENR